MTDVPKRRRPQWRMTEQAALAMAQSVLDALGPEVMLPGFDAQRVVRAWVDAGLLVVV